METFTAPKALVKNTRFPEQRLTRLAGLQAGMIDAPILGLIKGFNRLPHCFTLQCCYGHFTYPGQNDPYNLAPLPRTGAIKTVEYRIAYLALCLENNDLGRSLFDNLKAIEDIDPNNIQFGCAEWFWNQQINSYALQVEPARFKYRDTATLGFEEALHIEQVRDAFFTRLYRLIGTVSP